MIGREHVTTLSSYYSGNFDHWAHNRHRVHSGNFFHPYTYPHSDRYADAHADLIAHRHLHPDRHEHAHAKSNAHPDRYEHAQSDAFPHVHQHPGSLAHCDLSVDRKP
jgi:hypothetical protein